MSTSARKRTDAHGVRKRPQRERAYVPTTALAKAVEFDAEMMRVVFTDGRVLGGAAGVAPAGGRPRSGPLRPAAQTGSHTSGTRAPARP